MLHRTSALHCMTKVPLGSDTCKTSGGTINLGVTRFLSRTRACIYKRFVLLPLCKQQSSRRHRTHLCRTRYVCRSTAVACTRAFILDLVPLSSTYSLRAENTYVCARGRRLPFVTFIPESCSKDPPPRFIRRYVVKQQQPTRSLSAPSDSLEGAAV